MWAFVLLNASCRHSRDDQQQKSLFSNVKLISEHVTSVYPFLHGNIEAQLLGATCAFLFHILQALLRKVCSGASYESFSF